MTKSSKDQSSSDHLAMLGKMPFNPLTDAQLKAWSDLGAEVLQFASSRVQQDMEAQKAMLACRSPQDLQKVQAEYFSKALEDYRVQVQRAMEVMSGAAKTPIGDLLKSTKRGYDDVPL